ncbi:hypothetical protein [Rathayibacter sp. AY1E1]|uniref:hypothetical protein n=1 Tax=Rathayibacter sp. AY1E1 TaxID=2080549 RepID=UPI000CE82524|nr:hypothetical protein [Rathayibacter sp. AY1E1]PPH50576.1 hypothetical protein C5C67_13195 [Rathayibacter sp. AY1E1]
MMRTVDGTFNLLPDERVEVISAPDWSRSALEIVNRSLNEAARIAENRRLSDQAALDQILALIDERLRPTAPAVAEVTVEKITTSKRKKWKTILKRMGVAAGIVLAAMEGVNTVADFAGNVEATYEQVSDAYQRAANGSVPTPSDSASPQPQPSEPSPEPDPDQEQPATN